MDEKMTPWVKKKIVEYLGEEEPTLTAYIIKMLLASKPVRRSKISISFFWIVCVAKEQQKALYPQTPRLIWFDFDFIGPYILALNSEPWLGFLLCPQPQEIIKEVEPVLDTDSEIFVVKMWRMLLFEVIRADSLWGGRA
jgi:hypothetical protein